VGGAEGELLYERGVERDVGLALDLGGLIGEHLAQRSDSGEVAEEDFDRERREVGGLPFRKL
jgi:hypothetical protein